MNQFRLSTNATHPISNNSITAVGTVYLVPFNGQDMLLWNGSTLAWTVITESTVRSITLSALLANTTYDIFAYKNADAIAIEALAWTNDTTRATAISLQDGLPCKTGDKTRLYLGSMHLDASKTIRIFAGTTAGTSKFGHLGLFNYYNRIPYKLFMSPAATGWGYTSATWRAWKASNAQHRIEIMLGVDDQLIEFELMASVSAGGAGASSQGIGINSTATRAATDHIKAVFVDAGGVSLTCWCATKWIRPPGTTWPGTEGFHLFNALEAGDGTNAMTNRGGAVGQQIGMIATLMA
jgi:hypothetical protein